MSTLIYKDLMGSPIDVDIRGRILKGYASVFGNEDSDRDRIVKGSYAKTIKEWGPEGANRIKLCWQHNIQDAMGNTRELYEDNKGLGFVAEVPKGPQYLEDRLTLVDSGVVDELSVGIIPIKTRMESDNTRSLLENKLFEYSLVTLASNELAKVTELKGMASVPQLDRLYKKSKTILKTLRSGEMHDNTYHELEYLFELYRKAIADALEPVKEPTPDEPVKTTRDEAIEEFKKSLTWN